MPPPLVAHKYHVAVNGQPYGPFEEAMLRQMLAEGRIKADSQVWRDGMSGWVAMNQCAELQGLFAPASSGLPPMPGMPPIA